MAYKEVSRVEITEILRRWQAGATVRGLARTSGLSRNTVKKYIMAAEGQGLTRDGPPPTENQTVALVQINIAGRHPATIPTESVLGTCADQIHRWLKDDGLRLTRIQELLLKHNCDVAYTSLRRFIARRGWGKNSRDTVRLADTGPGCLRGPAPRRPDSLVKAAAGTEGGTAGRALHPGPAQRRLPEGGGGRSHRRAPPGAHPGRGPWRRKPPR